MREWIKVLCFLVIGSFFIYIIGSRVQSWGEKTGENGASLVIYTQHPTEFVTPSVREYEARTGVEVEVVRGGSGELLERIRNEKEAPTADVLWGGSLYTVKPYAELFEDYHTENEPYVQAQFRNVEGNLTRFTDVPSVIMVNTDLLGDRTIEGYEDLLNPEFYGKIAFADPSRSSSSLEQLINMLYACREDGEEWGWNYSIIHYNRQDNAAIINTFSQVEETCVEEMSRLSELIEQKGIDAIRNTDTLSAAIYEEIYRVNQQNRCSSLLYLLDSNGELL